MVVIKLKEAKMRRAKLILFIAAVVLFLSCKALDRINPTDPKSGDKYIGISYKNEFGEFSTLLDFALLGTDIYAVETGSSNIYKYDQEGTLKSYWAAGVTNTTGVCCDAGYIYIPAEAAGSRWVFLFDPMLSPAGQFPTINNTRLIASDNTNLYITTDEPKIYKYIPGGTTFAPSGVTIGAMGTADGEFQKISDIKVHFASGNIPDAIIVADSILDRISIFDLNGNYLRKIEPGFDIIGVGVRGNTLFVPNKNGVYEISYLTGAVTKKWGDYGEGNGKITAPDLCEAAAGFVLIGAESTIKKFAP